MEGQVTWEVLILLAGATISVGTLVGSMLIWMHGQIRAFDKALSDLRADLVREITDARHGMRNELHGEVTKTDNDLERRREEIQTLAQRVTRIEGRLNGNHKT